MFLVHLVIDSGDYDCEQLADVALSAPDAQPPGQTCAFWYYDHRVALVKEERISFSSIERSSSKMHFPR
jgi:hypothetical protein